MLGEKCHPVARKLNVERAAFVKTMLQIELYEALKEREKKSPKTPEAFRLWLHRED
jgi:hypothetical protein